MPHTLFFPNSTFGWFFCLALGTITVLASYWDWKRFVIPKKLSLVALGLGMLLNVVRGGWLGSNGQTVWLWDAPSASLGAVDGALFALAGFGVGFGLFFALWLLGTCGGGDVKLMAALGAWIGPLWAIYVLIGSWLVVVFTVFIVRGGKRVASGKIYQKSRKIAYSFPVALSTMLVLLWVFRAELLMRGAPPPAAIPGAVPVKR
jgi:Flp pilus assembly protein protease CpaA